MFHAKFLQSPTQLFKTQKQLDVPEIQNLPATFSPLIQRQCSKFSRRELTLFTKSSLLLLLTSQTLDLLPLSKARAEENPQESKVETDPQEVESVPQVAEEVARESKVETDPQAAESVPEVAEEIAQESKVENVQQAVETSPQRAPENLQESQVKNDEQEAATSPKTASGCSDKISTKRAFLDISIDGQPTGRIVVGLYGERVPVGAARFSDIVSGKAGISYRRKEFTKIMPNYVQHGGIRSYGVDVELASKTGRSLTNERLIEEWKSLNENCVGTKNLAGTLSIIIRDPSKPPPKLKLVAKQGKLQIDQEEVGVEPNGTEFTIATRDSPELDPSALVVGKVIEGMDVVEKIGQVKTVQENTSSPYFRVAKLIGDKRAVVAERGFNRPYSKVIVTNCGLLE